MVDRNRKKNSNMADVCFSKPYLSRKLRYVYEIWSVDRFWTSKECNDIKYETGSSTVPATVAAILKLHTT